MSLYLYNSGCTCNLLKEQEKVAALLCLNLPKHAFPSSTLDHCGSFPRAALKMKGRTCILHYVT